MNYVLRLFDWSLYTLPSGLSQTDIETDSHANDPASSTYDSGIPTWIGQDFTFNGGAAHHILVNDDDGDFEDAYVETGGTQTLAEDVTIDGTLYTAGSQIQNEFSMVDSLGNEVWVLRINVTNVGFVYKTGEEPTIGEAFTATNGRDGDPAESGDGVASAEPYTTLDGRNGTVSGTAGNDTIDTAYKDDPEGDRIDDGWAGGSGTNDNFVEALGGNDSVHSGLGNDTVLGGDGADTIYGEDGNDSLEGGSGSDQIFGGSGADNISGGEGPDRVEGNDGNDTIVVDQGDKVSGGGGDDYFILQDLDTTGTGNDPITIIGGEGGETNGDTLQLTPDVTYDDITFTDTGPTGLSGNFTMADGTVVTFSEIENIICFTPGTMILAAHGERPVESLKVGDFVVTRDNGLQPIRWIGKRTVPGRGRFAPVSIAAHVMEGARAGLLVSPQHRLLFTGYHAQLLFGESEVLAAAKHMVDGCDIKVQEQERVTYIHFMCDRHEIVYAEGIATESFHAGDTGLDAISGPAREELFAIFPELRTNPGHHRETARPCLKRYEAKLLCEKNSSSSNRHNLTPEIRQVSVARRCGSIW